MYPKKLIDFLKNSSGRERGQFTKALEKNTSYEKELQAIFNSIEWNEELSYSEKYFLIANRKSTADKCIVCGDKASFIDYNSGYKKFCCQSCYTSTLSNKNPSANSIEIDGILYNSFKDASEKTGLSLHKLKTLVKKGLATPNRDIEKSLLRLKEKNTKLLDKEWLTECLLNNQSIRHIAISLGISEKYIFDAIYAHNILSNIQKTKDEKEYWEQNNILGYDDIIVPGKFKNKKLGYIHEYCQEKKKLDLFICRRDILTREQVKEFMSNLFILDGKFIDRSAKYMMRLPWFCHIVSDVTGYPGENEFEALYWLFNDLNDYKRCECGNPIAFCSVNTGYDHNYCSSKCSNNSSTVKENKKSVSLEKYGCECPNQNEEVKKKIRKTFLQNWLSSDRFNFSGYTHISENYKGSHDSYFVWECEACGHTFNQTASSGVLEPICPSCTIRGKLSKPHRELYDFIKEHYNGRVIVNDRTVLENKLELDIHIPDLNLALEMNGSFWHSYAHLESKKERHYHFNKTIDSINKGIQLIHVFEYEWVNQREAIKKMVLSKLGKLDRIGARECFIKELTFAEASMFLNKWHLQGTCSGKIYLGLYNKDELISVTVFGKPRFTKETDWELLRYCSIKNVIGGFNKMLSYFRKDHQGSILSYADRTKSKGDVYEKSGFVLVRDTLPGYIYVLGKHVKSRYDAQTRRLKTWLPLYDDTLKEHENMFANGYRRMWNSGNLVYILK